MGVGSRSKDGRSTGGSEELVESLDELNVEERFEVVCSVTERFDGSKDGEGSLFDETLIWVAKDVSKHREDVPDHVERVLGDASKTVGGGGDGCSLDVGREEVEEVKESAEPSFSNDRVRVLLRDLLHGLWGEEKERRERNQFAVREQRRRVEEFEKAKLTLNVCSARSMY